MMLWHRNACPVTGPLWGKSTSHWWIPLKKGQQCKALMFSLMYTWKNGWTNTGKANGLRHHVIVMNSRNITMSCKILWCLKGVKYVFVINGFKVSNHPSFWHTLQQQYPWSAHQIWRPHDNFLISNLAASDSEKSYHNMSVCLVSRGPQDAIKHPWNWKWTSLVYKMACHMFKVSPKPIQDYGIGLHLFNTCPSGHISHPDPELSKKATKYITQWKTNIYIFFQLQVFRYVIS